MKPPYRVPLVSEVLDAEPNGYSVVSTFTGAGGSCFGFRMAGFRPLWASEFVPAARETYRANFPDVVLDDRDVRTVTGDSIREATGLDEFDVLEGSPPCSPFSTAGRREKTWGEVRKYSDVEQVTDDLFDEYVRLLRELRPRAFVAENVSGLIKGKAKGFWKRIFGDLVDSGYEVRSAVLDAQWLGVPQARQRMIFLGVRSDLGVAPRFPTPLSYRYSIRDAIADLAVAPIRRVTARTGPHFVRREMPLDDPSDAIIASGSNMRVEVEEVSIERYAIGREYDRLAPGEASERYFNLIRPREDRPSPTVTQTGGVLGAASVVHPTEKRKFTIAELRRLCGFPDDFVLTGDYRQQWERLGRAVPPPMMFHVAAAIRDVLEEVDGR